MKVFPKQDGSCPSCSRSLTAEQPIVAAAEPVVAALAVSAYAPVAARPPMPIKLMIPGILVCLLGAIGALISIYMMIAPQPVAARFDDPEMQAAANRGRAVAGMAASPIVLVLYLVAAVGGLAMLKRQYWGLALAGAILSLVPCSFVFCLGVPVGIWSVIVLSMRDVRAGFR